MMVMDNVWSLVHKTAAKTLTFHSVTLVLESVHHVKLIHTAPIWMTTHLEYAAAPDPVCVQVLAAQTLPYHSVTLMDLELAYLVEDLKTALI